VGTPDGAAVGAGVGQLEHLIGQAAAKLPSAHSLEEKRMHPGSSSVLGWPWQNVVGLAVGASLGSAVGLVVGFAVGASDGVTVGLVVGIAVGMADGEVVGWTVG